MLTITTTISKAQATFEALQAKYRAADDKASEARYQLKRQYGENAHLYGSPRGKRERVEALYARADKAMERIFAWLDAHSPRSWRSGAPAHWICNSLTYADAMTAGQLSVIPPVCYGYYPSDMVRFAAAIA